MPWLFSSIGEAASWPTRHPARAGALAGWVQQGASLGSAILLIPIVTASLPAAQAGVWFVFQSLMGMIALVDLGFGFAIARQAAFTLGSGGKGSVGGDFVHLAPSWPGLAQLFGLTRRLYLLLALIAVLLALAIFEALANIGQLLPSVTFDVRFCWYMLSVAIVFIILSGGESAFLNGLGKVYQTRLIAAGYAVLAAAGAAFAAWMGWGLAGMGTAFALAALVQFISTTMVRRLGAPLLGQVGLEPIDRGSLRALARAALPVGGVNAFGALVYSAQTPLLGALLGPEKVAPFYLAQKIAQACNMAVMHTVSPQMPFFTREYGAGDLPGALRLMNRTLVRSSVLVVISSVAFFLLSPLAAKVLLNRMDFLATLPLALLALDVLLLGLTVPWAWFVLASGRNPFVLSTILHALLTVGAIIFFVPKLGVAGIPLSSLLAGLLTNYWFNLYRGSIMYRDLKRATFTPR
jgi:O-antigen/teichoic acid export membrane protein